MIDREVRVSVLIPWLLWTPGVVLVALSVTSVLSTDVGLLGILAAVAGNLATLYHLLNRMERREVAAFDLGREAGMRAVR